MLNKLLNVTPLLVTLNSVRYLNANSASIVKIHRKVYARTYPTVMVLADGSTINFRYHEPRRILKMPLDLTQLTEAERIERLEKRKPKIQIKIEQEIEDNFDSKKYLRFMKK